MSNLVSSLALWVPKRVRAVCILTITILLTGLTTITKSAIHPAVYLVGLFSIVVCLVTMCSLP